MDWNTTIFLIFNDFLFFWKIFIRNKRFIQEISGILIFLFCTLQWNFGYTCGVLLEISLFTSGISKNTKKIPHVSSEISNQNLTSAQHEWDFDWKFHCSHVEFWVFLEIPQVNSGIYHKHHTWQLTIGFNLIDHKYHMWYFFQK